MGSSKSRGKAQAVHAGWPPGAAGRVLLGLVLLGVAFRLLAIISLWPVTTTLEDGYQTFASNPFMDPLHPAGYGLILAAIGVVTHEVAVPVLLQHASGIASALLLWAATRRITGSEWAGLLPAGIILLSGDEIFLEQSIMSESLAVLSTAIGLYAAARTMDQPEPWTRWPLLTGLALAIAVVIRSAVLPIIPVVVLALILSRPQQSKLSRRRWRAPLAAAGMAAIVLLAFAGANAKFGDRFGVDPSPGWYLYGRVAQFADCKQFTPPAGTAALCTTHPASHNGYYYMFETQAPAPKLFGGFGVDDGLIDQWAQRALRAQFGSFLSTAWAYLRSYWVPSSRPAQLKSSTGLDPQLDFTYPGNAIVVSAQQKQLEDFYDPFTAHRLNGGLHVLRGLQLVIRFGATALFVTTLLTLLGLVVGTRRSRVGVLLFGIGGLSLIVAPALTGTYAGRYTVPMAGPLMAAAAITITEIWRRIRRGRATPTGGSRLLSGPRW
jgi:hypothetical protein